MVSSHGVSGGYGWTDVAYLMEAFEEVGGCQVEIVMRPVRTKGKADVSLRLMAVSSWAQDPDPIILASVNVTCSGTLVSSLTGAVTHALYLLDAELGRREMAGREVNKA